jgi:hypothetical protein
MIQTYIYTQTGHNFGLEELRRGVAIYKQFSNIEPILATSDFRASSFAKDEMGVKKGVGVDIITALPHLMTRRDILIYGSKEASDFTKQHMKEYCTILLEMGVDIPNDIVEDDFFDKIDTKRDRCFFFSDDDYEDEMLNILCKNSKKHNLDCLLGHYFFMGHDKKLSPYFNDIIEEEYYKQTIKETKYLLSASVHSCLESLASGNCPVFFQRQIKVFKGDLDLIQKYNIPIICGDNLDELIEAFDKQIQKYPQTKEITKIDISGIINNIEQTTQKFEKILGNTLHKVIE